MNIFRDLPPTKTPDAPVNEWVALARQAYQGSTDWWTANYNRQWEKNISLFRGVHPPGSKYHSDAYRHRAKVFRPKTRSSIRRNEAACAIAFFGSDDTVTFQAEDENDSDAMLSASIRKQLLNERLTNPEPDVGIPWFQTLIGGYQDAMVTGAVCSHQYWDFREEETRERRPVIDPMTQDQLIDGVTGELAFHTVKTTRIVRDKPCCDLVPIENIRFDPSANWTNPIDSSPYVIHLMPMYVHEVRERMTKEDSKTLEPAWMPLEDHQIAAARTDRYNAVRQAREGRDRQDPKQEQVSRVGEFDIVWVHKNIMRKDGQDWLYYTMGADYLLTKPVPMSEVYWHGMRPYTLGNCVIETHRTVPSGTVQLGEQLQIETNELANQRIDNIRLVLNKRYFVRRGGNVDIRSLMRNVPGSATPMEDPQRDVQVVDTPDITASAYQEQDRLNLDYDEVMGAFSPGSVQSNRKLNETVGGLNLLSQDANQISEYQMRILAETWIEPTLRQLDALIVHYETDEQVLKIAGQKAKEWRQQEITPELLQKRVAVRVKVGFGVTNPQARIEKMLLGINAIAQIVPNALMRANEDEFIEEIFSILGHQGSTRFFEPLDGPDSAMVQQLQQQMQQLQQQIETEQAQQMARAQAEIQIEQAKSANELEMAKAKAELPSTERDRLGVDRERLALEDRKSRRDSETKRDLHNTPSMEDRVKGLEELLNNVRSPSG